MPTFNIKEIDPINQRNLKRLENGGTTEFWQYGRVLAIGDGHKKEVMDAVKGGQKGTIKITKGSLTDPGTLEAHGPIDRVQFTEAVKRISKKKVIYK